MGLIDQVLADDAAAFIDPDLMPGVESVTFIFLDGTTRKVNAQVFREGSVALPGMASGVTPRAEIAVANNGTTGLLASEVVPGLRCQINLFLDGRIITLAVMRPDKDGKWPIDAGILRLGLR